MLQTGPFAQDGAVAVDEVKPELLGQRQTCVILMVGTLMAAKTEGRDELLAPVPALWIELGE